MHSFKLALAAGVAALMAGPAMAQKSKDTLRLAINDPFPVLSGYCQPVDEAGNFYRRVYGTLISFDERNHQVIPHLAKSWKRVNPTTWEFELFDNITYHNGSKFDADDVVSTIEYTSDPKQVFEFKSRYTWVKSIEKLGPYKVRLEGKSVNAMDLGLLGYRTYIQDKESFDKHESKCDYGRLTPYGTAQYKVTSIDRNAGIMVERFENFKGDPKYFRAPIRRIHGVPIPDRQTQIAQLMTQGVDMLRNVTPDNAEEMVKQVPNLAVTILPTGSFVYIVLDAAGRSGNKPLTDPRVRRALWMALDRDAIIKGIVPGGKQGVAEKMMKLCFDHNIACDGSNNHPPFDPAGAKRLLAEAGYPNGIDIVYDVFIPIKYIGEAIAGELLKVGIRAKVNPVTIQSFRKKQSDGEIQMVSIFYPTAGHPDTGNIFDVFFEGPRDYARDPQMTGLLKQGLEELDDTKRKAVYKKATDLNNEKNYVMAFSSLPTNYVHTKDIEVRPNLLSAGDNYIDDYFWK
jgi:peptide/nickel transport system substrate-binding protein